MHLTTNQNRTKAMRPKENLIAVDTECGDAGPQNCESAALLSIGGAAFVPCGAERKLVTFQRLVIPEPGLRIEPGAVEVNGYSRERWAERGAVPEGGAVKEWIQWVAGVAFQCGEERAVMLAHNAGHDSGFLMAALRRQGFVGEWEAVASRRWRCSCAVLGAAQDVGLVPGEMGASLDALTALRTGVTLEEAKAARGIHDADGDAELCLLGYEWLLGVMRGVKPPKGGTPTGEGAV